MRFDPQSNSVERAPVSNRTAAEYRNGPSKGLLVALLLTILGASVVYYLRGRGPMPEPARADAPWQAVVSDTDATERYYQQLEREAQKRRQQIISRTAYDRGRKLLAVGQSREALPHLEAAVSADPSFTKARYDLILAYVRVGQADAASKQLEELRAIDPSQANLLENLIRR